MPTNSSSRLNRRTLALSTVGALTASQAQARGEKPIVNPRLERAELPPRKALIATTMQGYYGRYPGLTERLAELRVLVEEMAAVAEKSYPGRRLDLIVLPENAVTIGAGEKAASRSVRWEGPVAETFVPLAKKLGSYLMVPLDVAEDTSTYYNAVILLDRKGQVAGTYRKAHPVCGLGETELEGGISPGREFPVFNCDFGRLGIQICYDMVFDDGWAALAKKGADLVAWPSASPATIQPASRAREHGYYIVSSTYRHNASVIEPTGVIQAQLKAPARALVQEIDLSFLMLPWSGKLRSGQAFKERYGDKAGFRYYEGEDIGIFWSNDPLKTIGQMARELGLLELNVDIARNERLQDKHRGGPAR